MNDPIQEQLAELARQVLSGELQAIIPHAYAFSAVQHSVASGSWVNVYAMPKEYGYLPRCMLLESDGLRLVGVKHGTLLLGEYEIEVNGRLLLFYESNRPIRLGIPWTITTRNDTDSARVVRFTVFCNRSPDEETLQI